jgi:Tfp pilus assembly protein PilN
VIEVNLHPTGGKARRSRRPTLATPAWLGSGRGRGDGRDPWTLAAMVTAALAVLLIGGLWFMQRSSRSDIDARLEEARADSTRLADLRVLSDSLTARGKEIPERLDLVRGLDEGRFVWPHLLDELATALPEYTWLTAVRVSTPLPDLTVQVDGIAANPLAITRFVRNLQGSEYVEQVRIMGSQQAEVDNVSAHAFKIVVTYADPSDSPGSPETEGS